MRSKFVGVGFRMLKCRDFTLFRDFSCGSLPKNGACPSYRDVERERKLFGKYQSEIVDRVLDLHETMHKDFLAVSDARMGNYTQSTFDISGSYEYFFHRREGENYNNLYRRVVREEHVLPLRTDHLVLDVDALSKQMNSSLSISNIKLCEYNNFIIFVLDAYSEGSLENNSKVFVKDIVKNVVCEIDLPSSSVPIDIEISSGCPGSNKKNVASEVVIFVLLSDDGIRPCSLNIAKLDRDLAFDSVLRRRSRNKKSQLLRNVRLMSHEFICLQEEKDSKYFLDLAKSRDNKYLLVHSHSKISSETSIFEISDAWLVGSKFWAMKKVLPRLGKQFFVNHAHGCFYVVGRGLSNTKPQSSDEFLMYRFNSFPKLRNFPPVEKWSVIWPVWAVDRNASSNESLVLDDYDIFDQHILIYSRGKSSFGDVTIQLLEIYQGNIHDRHIGKNNKVTLKKSWNGQDFQVLLEEKLGGQCSSDCVWTVTPNANGIDSATASFVLSSILIPEIRVVIDLAKGDIKEFVPCLSSLVQMAGLNRIKNTNSSSLFSPGSLLPFPFSSGHTDEDKRPPIRCDKVVVESSHDGYRFPLVIYRPEELTTPSKTLLVGYGAYGVCLSMHYDTQLAVYLNEGWTVAMACIRGGGELGKQHYDRGRKSNKWNSFFDFKDCATYIIDHGFSTRSLLCASGNSAGGLVMGVMINEFSSLFRAIVLRNPFLDVEKSVRDRSGPLTLHEHDEWGYTSVSSGSDAQNEALKVIKSYSPMSNLERISQTASGTQLPSVLITVGLQDDKVDPMDSFQWISALRNQYALMGDSSANLFLNVQNQGHEGGLTVEDELRESAIEISFLEREIAKK